MTPTSCSLVVASGLALTYDWTLNRGDEAAEDDEKDGGDAGLKKGL
jgi:hypothetical protein